MSFAMQIARAVFTCCVLAWSLHVAAANWHATICSGPCESVRADIGTALKLSEMALAIAERRIRPIAGARDGIVVQVRVLEDYFKHTLFSWHHFWQLGAGDIFSKKSCWRAGWSAVSNVCVCI